MDGLFQCYDLFIFWIIGKSALVRICNIISVRYRTRQTVIFIIQINIFFIIQINIFSVRLPIIIRIIIVIIIIIFIIYLIILLLLSSSGEVLLPK